MDGFIVVPHEARYWTLEARIGTSITVAARGPGHHYPCRGDTVDHRTARHVELLVALYDNELGVTVVATAIASTALFLGSILAQEIARARSETSRIERSRCHAVRVWRGNRFTSDIKRPGDEFALTIVGPWTSIVLGFGFGLGAFEASSAGIGSFAEIAGKLGCLNVILGLFNLLPKVPPDGGHLPEATVWRITPQIIRERRPSRIARANILAHRSASSVSTKSYQSPETSSLAGHLMKEDLNRHVFVRGQITRMTSSPNLSLKWLSQCGSALLVGPVGIEPTTEGL